MSLLIFGLGYTASAYARTIRTTEPITATVRSDERADNDGASGIARIPFDGKGPSDAVRAAIRTATKILVSIPPGLAGDPVLVDHAADIASAKSIKAIVYLSTVGVYGDAGGGWVDERTHPHPVSARSVQRLATESAWRNLAEGTGKPLATLRLAGIYGPGRNALANLSDGTARRLVKRGQVFNRIHVDDIATAIGAAFGSTANGIYNVTDDEPAPPQDVVAFAAALMGIDPPPEEDFAVAELTPMARSFYGENKRVSNRKMKESLGVRLAYPTYREGLAALFARGEAQGERV